MNSKETLKQFFFKSQYLPTSTGSAYGWRYLNGVFFRVIFARPTKRSWCKRWGLFKKTRRGDFSTTKFTNPTVGGRHWAWNQRSFYLQRSRWQRSWGVGSLPVILKLILQRRAKQKLIGKVQNKNHHDGCLFLSISSLIHLVQHWHLYKLWWLLPLLQKLAFICCARRNSRTIVVADLKKQCSHSPHKTRLRGLIGNVQRICLSVYMPRNDSGVSQVQEEWWRPRGVKGCFSIGNSTISAMLLCRAGTSCHPFVIVLHFSGYGTSEEGHAKRTGRRGHLMQQKTAGKEFSFGRFWRFWFVWGFVDGFWMFGMVSLRGFKNFVPPRSSRVWFRSHWNIFGSRQRLPVALTNDFSRVKRNLPYGQYGLVKRNTYSSKTICNHV